MLEMSLITVISQLYSQVTDFLGNVIVKRINIRLFDLLTRRNNILNPPHIMRFYENINLSNIIHIAKSKDSSHTFNDLVICSLYLKTS